MTRADVEHRGMPADPLILWGGEFGRSPAAQLVAGSAPLSKQSGRDHHHHGFSDWLSGGGVKDGHVHGATDELGLFAVKKKVHVHEWLATTLHLLGLDHKRLTCR